MAFNEGVRTYTVDGVGQCDSGQNVSIRKSTVSDGGDGARHRVFGALNAGRILNKRGPVLVEQHAINRAEIRIIGCDIDIRQGGAVSEGFFFDGDHRVGNIDGGDIIAAIESASSYVGDTGFDDDRFDAVYRPGDGISMFVRPIISHKTLFRL